MMKACSINFTSVKQRSVIRAAAIVLAVFGFLATPHAAENSEITACGVINAADAEQFVGGPLEVSKIDKKIMLNAPWSYDSICTYIARGANASDPAGAARFLDINLRFFPSAETAQKIHDVSVAQFRRLAESPDAPFRSVNLGPLEPWGNNAFLIEVVASPESEYRSAQILFVKGAIGGSISAWKKPEPSLETTKAALKHILSRLP